MKKTNQKKTKTAAKRTKKPANRKLIPGLTDVQTEVFRNFFDDKKVTLEMVSELKAIHDKENIRAHVLKDFAFVPALKAAADDANKFDTLLADLVASGEIDNFIDLLPAHIECEPEQAEELLNEMIEIWDINLKLGILADYDIV